MSNNVTRLDIRSQPFVRDFVEFCHVSMEHCVRQAEVSASEIMRVMTFLLEDSKRIAKMSKQTVEAVRRLKDTLDPKMNKGAGGGMPAAKLIAALREFARQYQDVQELLSPIIQALQFQDRIRQNSENLLKMLDVWLEERETVRRAGSYGDAERKVFGEALLKMTTMKEERDIVRTFINLLPAEEPTPAEPLFF